MNWRRFFFGTLVLLPVCGALALSIHRWIPLAAPLLFSSAAGILALVKR